MIKKPSVMCINCDLHRICFSEHAAEHVCRWGISKGEILIQPDQEVHQIYLVHAGAFKCEMSNPAGEFQIIRFFMPGDIIGLETLDNKTALGKITALEQSSVCALESKLITENSHTEHGSHNQMIHLISRNMRKLYLHHHQYDSAEKILVNFLLGIYASDQSRGNGTSFFRLPMTKKDIANYLHLTPETVSRIFTKLKQEALLEAQGKKIHVLNWQGLKDILQ